MKLNPQPSTDLDSKPSQLLRTRSNKHGFNLIVTGIRFTHLGWLKPRVMRLPRAEHHRKRNNE